MQRSREKKGPERRSFLSFLLVRSEPWTLSVWLHNFSTLMAEAADFSETLIKIYETTRRHIPEDKNFQMIFSLKQWNACLLLQVCSIYRAANVLWMRGGKDWFGKTSDGLAGASYNEIPVGSCSPLNCYILEPSCVHLLWNRHSPLYLPSLYYASSIFETLISSIFFFFLKYWDMWRRME